MKLKITLLFLVSLLCLNIGKTQEEIRLIQNDQMKESQQDADKALLNLYLDCPNDITVYAQPGESGSFVYWDPIDVSTSCGYCTTPIPNCIFMGDYNGHQYYCSMFETDKDAASLYASNYGAYLGSINSQSENDFLSNQLVNMTAYIGLADEWQEGNYEWESQESVSFTNWENAQPDDTNHTQNAVELKSNGKWNDCIKYYPKEFIIEFPCLDVDLVRGLRNGSYFPIGTTVVEYRFTDACGYTATCTFDVTVVGQQGGIDLDCPKDITTQCQDGHYGAYVHWPEPTATTTCNCNHYVPDCIDMGWHRNTQYFCSLFSTTWNDASNWAQTQNSELAVITNSDENNYLSQQLQIGSAYIGLSDPSGSGDFVWTDGSRPNYTNWASGEPSNIGQYRYVEMKPDGKWKTTPGNNGKEFIIEKHCPNIVQTAGPRNGSFFPVGMTTVEYTATDPCGNVATCTFKVTVEGGTTIHCPDDIIVDCEPSWQGNYVYWDEPTITSCCTDCYAGQNINGFIYMGSLNGYSYYCSTFDANWTDAESYCTLRGGHLASIADATENNYLAGLLRTQYAFIGLNDTNSEGTFEWSDQSGHGYRNWNNNIPNNSAQNDFAVLSPNGKWSLEDHYAKREFIMKLPCTHITQIEGKSPGSFFDEGTHRIKYHVQDGCGGTDYCTFYITVRPCCDDHFTLHCPDDYLGCPGDDIDPSNTGYASVDQSRYCQNVHIDYEDEIDVYDSCDIVIERTWTAWVEGDPGSEKSCVQWIDLIDDEAPNFSLCPDDISIEATGDDCSVKVYWDPPAVSDNCDIEQLSSNFSSGELFSEGVYQVVYVARDPCGNTDSCSFEISVTGAGCCEAPEINCPPDYAACPGSPIHPIHTGYPIVNADTSECGDYELDYWDEFIVPGNCPGAKTFERFWEVYYFDNPNEKRECIQIISLIDTIPPVLDHCPGSILIETDSCCSKQVFWQPPIASDDCGLKALTSDFQPGDYFDPGSTIVTYTAEDLCGNIQTCEFEVTVQCNQFTGYCTSMGTNSDFHWIESIKIEDNSRISGNNCGYMRDNKMHISFNPTAIYNLTLNAGSINGNTKGVWRAWIDFNRDGDFDDQLEEVVSPKELHYNQLETNFYIPSIAELGETVLRVSYQAMGEYQSRNVQNCCSLFEEGEVEDYKVIIQDLSTNNQEIEIDDEIVSVFPNPSSGIYQIEINSEIFSNSILMIFNSLGNVIYKKDRIDMNDSKDILDISDQEAGIYFLRIDSEKGSYTRKLILVK